MTTPASDPLHAHELSAADAAIIRMLSGAKFGPDATVVLPSGRRVTGAEMARWVKPPGSPVANLDLDAIEARAQSVTTWIAANPGPVARIVGADVPDLIAGVKRLRAAVPSWAGLRDLLAAKRSATDVELTNAVMALITGVDHE